MATRRYLLVFLLLVAPSFAQQAQPHYKLQGVVVNSLTGKPLPRALVVLSNSRAMLTGPEGEFAFDDLPPVNTMITVTKPGFFAPGARSKNWSTPINVQVGPDAGPALVKLLPEAVILGRVTGKDEEPLEGATVQLLSFTEMNGRRQLAPTENARTDEDGNFRLAGLIAGRYFVCVKAGTVSRRILGAQSKNSNEGYQALVYYPGTTDFSAAAALDLSAGQHIETNFALALVPMFNVAGSVAVAGEWKQVQPPMIVDRSEQPLFTPDKFDATSGVFEFKAVPAGTYFVRTAGMDQESHYVSARQTLTVARSVTNLKLSLTPGLNIPVIVRTEFSKERLKGHCSFHGPDGIRESDCSDYPAASLELLPDDGSYSHISTDYGPLKDPGAYVLHTVMPGKYLVRAHANFGGYVYSVRSGGVDLTREPLVVAEGADVPPIEITVRDDGATLKISVRREKPGQQATIVVFPEAVVLPEPRMVSSSYTAEVQSGPLPPGKYKVFAFDSINPLDYSNAEFLEKYAARASSVTLAAGGTASVTVDLIHPEE